ELVEINQQDVVAAEAAGTAPGLLDRLTLTRDRLQDIANAVRQVAELDDPVGDIIRGYRLPNGLRIRQVRVPLGVIGMIYEARPNVTVDAAALALKSGNAVLLRGSASAYESNRALVEVMRKALASTAIPPDVIQLVPGRTHAAVEELMRARGLVDVIIPRGGASLIRSVVEGSTVPVIETGVGNCHVYVDAAADVGMATRILLNAKVQRPSVCNAAETVLVHREVAADFWRVALPALTEAGVRLHGDPAVMEVGRQAGVSVVPATDEDWAAEYYSLDLAAREVADIGEAIDHIRRWSSGHTEAIITDSVAASTRFLSEVDSAAVMVNASTRFSDGEQFGFGAEIGISTQKLHARGPMGLRELTSAKFIVIGSGQIREPANPEPQ
ncbi:MAG: glutamate-5-semialdehyde dehydrogenase, partial [Candidatus Nanopelagicales bacterium]|nr:glutamate-5-semialdehyde dehydrogenase [Candidatus Nanopelagicales bacterium]